MTVETCSQEVVAFNLSQRAQRAFPTGFSKITERIAAQAEASALARFRNTRTHLIKPIEGPRDEGEALVQQVAAEAGFQGLARGVSRVLGGSMELPQQLEIGLGGFDPSDLGRALGSFRAGGRACHERRPPSRSLSTACHYPHSLPLLAFHMRSQSC